MCFDRTDSEGDAENWGRSIEEIILAGRITKYRYSLKSEESCFPMEFFECCS